MSEKYLPIKIFEKRKDYDDRSTEGGGDSHEGSWVLHGEELNKRVDYLSKNVNTIQDSFQKWKENKRALPMIISTTVIDKAIAKTHRGRIVNLLENDGKDNVIGVYGDRQLLSMVTEESLLSTIKCRLFVWLRDTSEVIDGKLFKKDLQGTYWDMNASIGVSFYVSDDVQKVNAYINWGKYYAEQVQGEVIDETLEEDAENKKKKKHTIYIREQMNDVVEIDFNLMGRSKQIPLESNGNIYIYVMKMQLDNGYKMVSVYLHNNDKSDGDEKEYAKVMFQVEMLIADDLMSPIFVPEYLCRKVELEDEYYYKGRPVYARGRGCAATWEKKAEEINATAIKSSFIPDYEIPSVSAQIDDMPEHAFSMLQMGSPKKKSEVIQNLRTLTEMYGSWITDALTNDEAMHDDKFKATGQTIIDK